MKRSSKTASGNAIAKARCFGPAETADEVSNGAQIEVKAAG